MNKDDFNRDLDDYITTRKNNASKVSAPSFVGTFKLFSIFRRRIPEESTINTKKINTAKIEKLENMEEEIEEIHETEEIMETQREGLIARFLKLLRFNNNEDYLEENEEVSKSNLAQKAIEDEEIFKDTLRSLHKWLEALPPETLNRFKRSEDFKKYKFALETFGLIKK